MIKNIVLFSIHTHTHTHTHTHAYTHTHTHTHTHTLSLQLFKGFVTQYGDMWSFGIIICHLFHSRDEKKEVKFVLQLEMCATYAIGGHNFHVKKKYVDVGIINN